MEGVATNEISIRRLRLRAGAHKKRPTVTNIAARHPGLEEDR